MRLSRHSRIPSASFVRMQKTSENLESRCFIAPESIAAHDFLNNDITKLTATASVAFDLRHPPPISGLELGGTKAGIDQRVSKGNIWMSRVLR